MVNIFYTQIKYYQAISPKKLIDKLATDCNSATQNLTRFSYLIRIIWYFFSFHENSRPR